MNTVTIIDYGGLLGEHVAQGKAYAAAGVMVAVKYCASACIFMLAMVPSDHKCFYPDAWIGFHTEHQLPQWQGGTESPTTMRWERGRDWIAKGFKPC